MLSSPGWDPRGALDSLVTGLAKGHAQPELFADLLAAAVRDDTVADLAFAFEETAQDRRIKLLAAPLQAELFVNAARCSQALGDLDGARTHAERAFSAAPIHAAAQAALVSVLEQAGDRVRLAKLHSEIAAVEKDPAAQLERLQLAAALLRGGSQAELAIDVLTRLLRADPTDENARTALEERLTQAGKPRDLAKLLEQSLEREPGPSPAEAIALRRRLMRLYADQLGEPQRAAPHMEALLASDPAADDAVLVAEALLEHKAVQQRAAAALSDAYEKLGRVGNAAAMLTLELKLARGPRRVEVQRRLAFLRQDSLDDPQGALELLGPVVAGDPGDDAVRARFVQLSVALDQPLEAARLLTRALATCKDPAVKARIGADVGRVYLRAGNAKQAQAAFQQVLDAGHDDGAMLEAARQLVEIFADAGDVKQLLLALEQVVRREPEGEQRHAAARRLARLCEREAGDPVRAVTAWRALVESPWADEALRRLDALHQASGDSAGLVEVLQHRARRTRDAAEARTLLERAAALLTDTLADRPRAIAAWQGLSQAYGPTREFNARLLPLLEGDRRWAELAEVLDREAALAPEAERSPLLAKLAQIRLTRLSDAPGALAALRGALALSPDDKSVRSAAERLLASGGARLEAANVLEPVYRKENATTSLLVVLETRGELSPTAQARLSALDEAVTLAREALEDGERALVIAATGLGIALAEVPAAVMRWLERVQTLGAVADPTLKARALTRALGARRVDAPEVLAVAVAAGEALASCGEIAEAVEKLRRALEFDPGSEDLVTRIDDLLVQQGDPAERLALYENALSQPCQPSRRRELLHALASLKQREFADVVGAIECWRLALADDPRDATAHTALVTLYTDAGDLGALYDELARAYLLLEGPRREGTLRRMAEVSASHGRASRALDHYRELLRSTDPPDEVLADVERLAREREDVALSREALTRRLEHAADPEARAQLSEALAQALLAPPVELERALAALRVTADLSQGEVVDLPRAERALSRLFELEPADLGLAERLVALRGQQSQWAEIGAPFAVLLAGDEKRAVRELLALEPLAQQPSAVATFAELAAAAAADERVSPASRRDVGLGLGRALARDPAQHEKVSRVFRGVLAGDPEEAAAIAAEFEAFLRQNPGLPALKDELRWLWSWRAEHSPDVSAALVAWAIAEESELSDPVQALTVYERLLAREPDRVDVLGEVARLKIGTGDVDGALASLAALRERTLEAGRSVVDLRIAGLLLDQRRAPAALDVLDGVIAASPGDAEALRLVNRCLGFADARARAATLLERAAAAAEDAEVRAAVLDTLLAMPAEAELRDARRRWFHALLTCRDGDPALELDVALRGAVEHPGDEELWDAAERAARRLDQPAPVADAYARALDAELSAELAETVGRRVVEFNEEWFEDGERVVELLRRVTALAPGASWAFDRLKLAFNAAGRWRELFELYDEALQRRGSDEQHAELLREAAMAAKDFAADTGRAIDYLERLDELAPGDPRVEQSLERLYEREGRIEPLIKLLTRRLHGAAGRERQGLRARIASLWLDDGKVMPAYELTLAMLTDEEEGTDAIGLLERLVDLPASRDSIPPGTVRERRKKRVATVRDLAAARLKQHYESEGRVADMVRMLEIELEVAETPAQRAARLVEIADLRLDRLGDAAGALDAVAQLVALQPDKEAHRKRLGELATRTGAEARRATLLADVAHSLEDAPLRARLCCEAAAVRRALGDTELAAGLYDETLRAAADPKMSLLAARELTELWDDLAQPGRRCDAFESLAALAGDASGRREALAQAAALASGALSDPARAVRAWRQCLADDPGDAEALDGLCAALDAGDSYEELIAALAERAQRAKDPALARADRERIARIHDERRQDAASAISAWVELRGLHGADRASFEPLAALLDRTGRGAELAELYTAESAREQDAERRSELLVRLGDTWRRLAKPIDAVGAFAAAGRWERAIEVAGEGTTEPDLALAVARRLLERAAESWVEQGDVGAARAAAWAVSELDARLTDRGRHAEVVELLLTAASLPFETGRRRELRRDAAQLWADRLNEPERALTELRSLIAEEIGDEVAASAVARLASLLEERGEHAEIVALWEQQARARAASNDVSAAAVLWARAATLAEERLGDADRALAAHRHAADLGSESSHEALARLYAARDEQRLAAAALEWLFERAQRESLADRALALAQCYLLIGEPVLARERLEYAAPRAIDASGVRKRLAELYLAAADWAALADLRVTEAGRAPDARARLASLREAAMLHMDRRHDAARAAPLLEQAVELEPDDPELRLTLAAALRLAGRLEDAERALRQLIERYGSRRPKDRALAHLALSAVLLAAARRDEALTELEVATKIDPAHPGILQALARLAFEDGQLERAERTYRALLLVLRTARGDGPSRSAALLDLSEIAVRRDDPLRATEFVESAFEAALESPSEAVALEASLRERGRTELLARAIETRLAAATRPEEVARALADLVVLHAEQLGGVGERRDALHARAASLESELSAREAPDEAWLALGRVFDALGDPQREAAVLERRIGAFRGGKGPRPDAGSFLRLAEVRLGAAGGAEAALELIEEALTLGLEVARASAALQAVLEREPQSERALVLLERVARDAGDSRTLASVLARRLRTGEVDPVRLRECVDLGVASGDGALAEAVLADVLGREVELPAPDRSWAELTRADLLAAAGRPAEALDARERAAACLPFDDARPLLLEVARIAQAEPGDPARAARVLASLLEQEPADRELWGPLLDLYRRLDDSTRLVQLIERTVPLVEARDDRIRLRLEQATVLLEQDGQREAAADSLREILTEDPGQQAAAVLLARLLEQDGKQEELAALHATQLDAAKDREDVSQILDATGRLGALLEQLSRPAEALDVYRGGLSWSPGDRQLIEGIVRLCAAADDPLALGDALESWLQIAAPQETRQIALRLAKLRREQGDPDAAERAIKLGFERCPEDVDLREGLIAELAARDAWSEVAAVLGVAFASAPTDPLGALRRVEAHRRAGEPEAAVTVLDAALAPELDGVERPESVHDVALYRERAALLRELGRAEAALRDLERAHSASGDHALALADALEFAASLAAPEAARSHTLRLVEVLLSVGELDRARQHLVTLLDAAPADLEVCLALATLEARAERWDTAAELWVTIVRGSDGLALVDPALRLAEAAERAGFPDLAREGLERALSVAPEHSELRSRLRAVYVASGEPRALARLLCEDADQQEDDARRRDLYLEAALLLLGPEGDAVEAANILESVRAQSPEDVDVAVLLARAYTLADRHGDGLGVLDEVAASHGGRRLKPLAAVYREMAYIQQLMGFPAEALASLSKAFEMDLRSGELALVLARTALSLGDVEVALKAYRSLSMMKTATADGAEGATREAKGEANYYLACAARDGGDARKAKLLVMKALTENPDHAPSKELLAELG